VLRWFGRDDRASVLVEFAICLPLLLLLYQIAFVLSDMVTCNRKVTVATRALVDMVSRNMSANGIQANPATTSASSFLNASAVVLMPYDVSKATEQVALLRVCDASHAWVVWTQAQSQTAAQLSAGTATATTSTFTAGTLSAASVVTIPSAMVTSPMIPVNSNNSVGICSNYAASSSNLTQLGQAGGYLFIGKVNFSYSPPYSYGVPVTTPMGDTFYMSPRIQ
jgi:Flp pilus assembly protein TadG